MADEGSNDFRILSQVAPGTPLRNAIELILQQETGALVVLGSVDGLVSGGFALNSTPFTPQKLAELAKMDGAIVLDQDGEYILSANVQLNPDAAIATEQTGMRMRTAERVARQTGNPVLAVSEGREVAAVYTASGRYELHSPTSVLAEANQNLQILERFRRRLDEADERLTRAEIADAVVGQDVVVVLQRSALVARLGRELDRFAVELGDEGQLLRLQIADLVSGVERRMELVYRDYSATKAKSPRALHDLVTMPMNELYDIDKVAAVVDLDPDGAVQPRGLRLLADVPRLPDSVEAALLGHFSSYQQLLHASVIELSEVEGVGRARAQQLRRVFDRMVDAAPELSLDDD